MTQRVIWQHIQRSLALKLSGWTLWLALAAAFGWSAPVSAQRVDLLALCLDSGLSAQDCEDLGFRVLDPLPQVEVLNVEGDDVRVVQIPSARGSITTTLTVSSTENETVVTLEPAQVGTTQTVFVPSTNSAVLGAIAYCEAEDLIEDCGLFFREVFLDVCLRGQVDPIYCAPVEAPEQVLEMPESTQAPEAEQAEQAEIELLIVESEAGAEAEAEIEADVENDPVVEADDASLEPQAIDPNDAAPTVAEIMAAAEADAMSPELSAVAQAIAPCAESGLNAVSCFFDLEAQIAPLCAAQTDGSMSQCVGLIKQVLEDR